MHAPARVAHEQSELEQSTQRPSCVLFTDSRPKLVRNPRRIGAKVGADRELTDRRIEPVRMVVGVRDIERSRTSIAPKTGDLRIVRGALVARPSLSKTD